MTLYVVAGKLSADDLNALIAHAHRRIDQLNRELAEQRVREQVHIEAALEQQKLEDQKALDKAIHTATQHSKEEARLEQERKVRRDEAEWGNPKLQHEHQVSCWWLNFTALQRTWQYQTSDQTSLIKIQVVDERCKEQHSCV